MLPTMAEEVKAAEGPVLLTEPGLIARYGLIDSWLGELRQRLMSGETVQALVLLTASDIASAGAMIDSASVPSGAGSREFARIPSAWLARKASEARTQARG